MADSSKTEKATPRRREKARERGQVTRSRELTGALSMFVVAGVLALTGRQGASHWTDFFRNTLDSARSDTIGTNGPLLFWTSVEAMRWIFPMQLAALTVSLLFGFGQGGFVFAPEALSLKFDRLNPVNRLQQLLSPVGLSSILKSLLPFSAIIWVGWACIHSHWGQILSCSYAEPRDFVSLVGNLLLEVLWKSGMVLLAWAGVDYLLLWLKSEGDLKMSRQDVLDEMKSVEGNPASKGRIRKMQRQARRRHMIKATETASVVITNPTHYAVALKFEMSMPAPLVVSKGLDLLAAKIKEIARDHDIPVMENRPLAQALYKTVEVGDAIPAPLYHAVAEILVLVYKAQQEVQRREAQRRAATNASRGVTRQ
ncbi:MAG: EscU/YscU/HrcU family type III secretion system export apparatus switch protein [Terracidiphilus sp.]|jgi:flagellar biosynthetic protein FlhB